MYVDRCQCMKGNTHRLAILGASGHGKVAADIAIQRGWDTLVFYDDAWPEKSGVEAWPVAGTSDDLMRQAATFDGVFVAIGNNRVRSRQLARLLEAGATLVTLIHPAAVVSPFATLDESVMLVAGAIVNAFASVGRGSIVNTGATVGHDCVLGDCVHVAPGAHIGGTVHLGDCAWIGIGASVRQCLVIGKDAVVGAGAAVVRPVADGQVVAGVPARPLGERKERE